MHDATRLRIARATARLERMVAFYRDGLGLPLLERFEKHAGYSGVILGLPGGAQLEFTQHDAAAPGRVPDPDDLLVLYFPSAAQIARLRPDRLGPRNLQPVNPYWLDKSVTLEDPDGWRVVLCDSSRPG
jgi:catechol 2,3-dioxygenase-like lactoylglutathione lyase family enzyme